MTIFEWEHNSLVRHCEALAAENAQLRAYCHYVACCFQSQAMVINGINPVVTSSMFDDLDDAMQVSGLRTDPREWVMHKADRPSKNTVRAQ